MMAALLAPRVEAGDGYLPSDWLATDPTKVWYVDDVQIN